MLIFAYFLPLEGEEGGGSGDVYGKCAQKMGAKFYIQMLEWRINIK